MVSLLQSSLCDAPAHKRVGQTKMKLSTPGQQFESEAGEEAVTLYAGGSQMFRSWSVCIAHGLCLASRVVQV